MSDIFLQILNMSIGAAYVIIAVIILRFLLKKAPKILSYSLWAVVLFRLVCPFSIESALSLFKMNPKPIASDIVYSKLPTINTQIDIVDKAINPVLATQAPALVPVASINPMQVVVAFGTLVWVFGMAIMLVYSIISLLMLKKRLVGAVRLEGNIWLCDGIKSPFVLGLFRPQIYLPSSLDEADRRYILMHEQNHIRRFDHVVKIVGFAALCLHWFNPLVWVAFFLFVKDMEMSCDEKVLKTLDGDVRGEYSALLLSLATGKRIVAGSPLAFGEGDTKSRIKNVMSYKKPAFWVVIVGVIAVVGIAVGLMLNPVSNTEKTVELTDIDGMNIGAQMPRLVCGDEHRVVMQGTFGLIVFDIDGEKITDRITYDELNKIGIEFLITAASEDGKTVYLSDKSAPFTHKYDVESGKIDKFNGEVDETFQTDAISAGNSLYDEYFDLTYLIGENIIKTSDGFIYLRASRYWQMKSLELIICPFDREKSKTIKIFGDFEKETFAPTTTPSLITTTAATTREAETPPANLINGALGETLDLADAATIKVKNSDSTAWEEASLETLINSDNADFIAEFDGWCYGMTEDGNAVKVSVGDSFDGFKVSKATASIKFQAGENSDEKTVYIMRSEFVLGGFYRLNGELKKPVDGYSVGELVFSTNKNNLQNMPEPITDYAFNNGLTEDDGRVYFDLGPPDDYNIDFSAVPDNGEVIAVVAELTDITFRAVDMKEAGNSAKFAGFADESVSTEIIQYPDVPEDVQTLFNQGGRTVAGLLGKASDTLPAGLTANVRTEPTVFYWIMANVLCSDIGYDLTPYLGKGINIEVYKIGFSDDYNIMQRGIVYRFDGKIIGAIIDKKHGLEYTKSLSFNSLEDITGMTLNDYWHKNYYDETDPVNVSATKRNARELVEYYHNAVVENNPERFYECYSPEKKVQNLFINVDASKSYNMPNYSDFTGYITSFKLKSMKKYWFDDDFYMQEDENEADENARADSYHVTFETKAREGTWAAIDGYKSRFITIVEENGILYISGIGTGP